MSKVEKGYGILKSVMLMGERFDAIDRRLERMSNDIERLSGSHSRLAERVSQIEGYLRAATGTPFGRQPRLEEK